MRKSKYLRLLKTLSAEELLRYRDFIASPYFNKKKKCLDVFNILMTSAPDFDDEGLDRKNLLDKVYTNKNSIKSLMQTLLRLLEEFMAMEELRQQDTYRKYLLLKQLLARDEMQHFKMIYKRAVMDYNARAKKSLLDFYHYFLITSEYFQYQFNTPDSGDPEYDILLDTLDTAYLTNRLKYTSSMVNLQRIKSQEMEIPSASLMLELVDEKRLSEIAIVKLYKKAYLLIVENTEEHFLELLGALEKNVQSMPPEEADSLYTALINFCIRKLAEGKVEYYHHLFDIYKVCLEENIFMVNNRLSPQRLLNTVYVGMKTDNFEWTERFLDENKHYIEKDFREIIFHYCKGLLYYRQGNLSMASDALLEANAQGTPKNTSQYSVVKFLKFNIQVLLLKVYYAEDETLAFGSLAKTFSERLRLAKEINPKELKSYLNFISIASLLFRYKTDPNFKKSLPSIAVKLEGLKHISDKQWLLVELTTLA